MTSRLERHQVPLYLAALGVGALAGWLGGDIAAALHVLVTPVLAVLIFLTFLGIPLRTVPAAWRDRRFLAVVMLLNFAVVPLVVLGLSRLVAGDRAVLLGVLLVLLTPCIDYVIVFAGLAGGSRERLLAVTPLLLLLQFALLPVYLPLLGGEGAAAIEPGPFLEALLLLLVVPLVAAAAAQAAAHRRSGARRVQSRLERGMVPVMALTLLLVVASQAAVVIDDLPRVAPAVPVFAAFAVVMTALGALAARLPGVGVESGRALLFSGVTRNSLVVLPLALALPAGYEVVPLVVVTQTLVELVTMVILVRAVPILIPERAGRPVRGGRARPW